MERGGKERWRGGESDARRGGVNVMWLWPWSTSKACCASRAPPRQLSRRDGSSAGSESDAVSRRARRRAASAASRRASSSSVCTRTRSGMPDWNDVEPDEMVEGSVGGGFSRVEPHENWCTGGPRDIGWKAPSWREGGGAARPASEGGKWSSEGE